MFNFTVGTMFIIKGKVTLAQYFIVMLVSTVGLVALTIASYLLPYDKTTVAIAMMALSILSIGASAKIILETTKPSEF
jgi:hypothetical protein